MKDTIYNLYLCKTNGIPKDKNGEEFEVVYCIEEDKEISTELEQNPNLRYLLIVLQKTKADLITGMRNVETEWNSFTDLTLEIEHITNDLKKITRNFRELLLDNETESIIFKSQVVSFDEKSITEQKEARKLILGVSTKSKWNFWN
ncbi:hypothetical protein ES692_07085 [Psychroserpens burtonensis]|uniref:Uncharacterized protein n=1 Tax=Psychroserpens burtonensis TaxID=49278 RepID=A0A5C7BBE6_9FLAO|nr:hypothetical protein [Psychroserpens burtonensis]TXE18404.1 hypothetical protein ES692_07085 [Psychroserpens burtonensis]